MNRIDITEIIGGFVRLKKRGANYLGLCPFHNERTPSFTVSPSKEIYKCFGCGRSGNAISFLMEHEKYSYADALRWLAGKYNIEIEETELSPERKLQQQLAESLFIINNFAQKYFSDQLLTSEEGTDLGLSYLKERGFREDIIRKFQLGYCLTERDAFSRAAVAAQYNAENLLKTGLVVMRDERLQDNYRGRVIFPVHNQTGKVIGFGARTIRKNDPAPKYINTPENEIYVKSRILYGLYFARQAIDKMDECLLVEGYTDVLSLAQAGIENVVASGGTSLTREQLRLIKKFTNNLTIIYDGDAAGVKAALRGLDMALEERLDVKLVLIPDNEDPDSYLQKVGASSFRDFVQASKKDVVLFQVELQLKESGKDSSKKAMLVSQVAETLSKMDKTENFTRQLDYIRQCAELLQIDEAGLHALVNKHIRERIVKKEEQEARSGTSSGQESSDQPESDLEDSLQLVNRDEQSERAIIRALLEFGLKPWDENRRVADYMFEESIDQEMIDNKELLGVLEQYRTWYKEGLEPTARNFLYQENQDMSRLVVSLMEFPYELSPNWKEHYEGKIATREDLYREEVISTLNYLKLRKIKRLIEMNQKDWEKAKDASQQMVFMQTHLHLKEMERQLLASLGTVIVK